LHRPCALWLGVNWTTLRDHTSDRCHMRLLRSVARPPAPLAARAEGRIGGRRKNLDDAKRREIAEGGHLGPQDRGTDGANVRLLAAYGVAYRRGSCGGPNVACAGYVEVGSANV
jgi:hypothetical protein